VLTASDGVAHGTRDDESGRVLAARLEELGFETERAAVPDDWVALSQGLLDAVERVALVVITGGTGLGPRDVTPQVVHSLTDYVVPGFGEVMRAEGRRSTPFASLSRSLAAVRGSTLVLALPGSPRAALESLDAVVPILDHALATLRGDTQRHPAGAAERLTDDGGGTGREEGLG
jgi:molybdopterin adenylyltransferase